MSQLDDWLRTKGSSPDMDVSITLPGSADDNGIIDRGSAGATDLHRPYDVGSGGASRPSNGQGKPTDIRSRDWMFYINNFISRASLDIRDRSQIINPEDVLADFWNENADNVQNRALYEQLLNMLRNLQAQQEASYQEWYNSTSQQALRDQAAGLNTDILGISGSSPASAAAVGSGAPMSGLPTSEELSMQHEQIRLSRFQSVMTAISSICSIPGSFATAFAGVAQGKAANAAAQLTQLQQLKEFENLAAGEISSRLSDAVSSALSAGQSLDLAEWFGNEDNFSGILESYSPPGTDFSASFANVRRRMQRTLGSAYGEGKVTAENQGSFSALLADPRYSADQLVQIAHLKPYMKARAQLDELRIQYESKVNEIKTQYAEGMDVDSAIDAANAKFEFEGEYYENRDGAAEAAAEWYVKEANGIVAQMRGAIEKNLLDMYNANWNNERGFSAAYLSGSRSMDWYEYLIAQEVMYGLKRKPVGPASRPPVSPEVQDGLNRADSWLQDYLDSGVVD